MRYYTVDRLGTLNPGMTVICDTDFTSCRFFPVPDHFTRTDLEALTYQLFTDGISSHGKKYLLDEYLLIDSPQGPVPYTPHIPMIELVSELVRRIYFPDKPSRFTTLFAWGSRDEAVEFQQQYGTGNIYEVEAEEFFRGDMNLLLLGGSCIGALQYATMYWKGEGCCTPRWEYLLVPPIHVIDIIDNES